MLAPPPEQIDAQPQAPGRAKPHQQQPPGTGLARLQETNPGQHHHADRPPAVDEADVADPEADQPKADDAQGDDQRVDAQEPDQSQSLTCSQDGRAFDDVPPAENFAAFSVRVQRPRYWRPSPPRRAGARVQNQVARQRAMLMTCSWVNSIRPSSPSSTPRPDCLAPPKGML